jgi:Kdo2-lipid IVA lauroyltransferase/acyltransferase
MKSSPRFRTIVDYLVYLAARFLDELINLLPERWVWKFGRFVGRLIYVMLRDRREAALENLTIAFGAERPRAWIVQTARKNFEHLGLQAMEFLRIRRWDQQTMADRIVIEGSDPYNLCLLPGQHGIVLLNSHFGCFEVSAATVKFLGFRTHLIATMLKNRFLSRYFVTRAGKNTGIFTHPHKGSVKELIQVIQQGGLLACLADQRGDPERGIFVDFFGTPAPANEVFAKMTIEGYAHILPLYTIRTEDGRYRSEFCEGIPVELTGDTKRDLTELSQQFHTLFEQWLRAHPEQGFWLHRKWRRKSSRRRSTKD